MDHPDQPNHLCRRFFLLGCWLEGCLFLGGATLSWIFGQGFLSDLHWTWRDALIGTAAAVPPLALFCWTCQTQWEPLWQIQRFLDQMVLPIFQGWTVGQLLLLSILAGFAEELFFRGAIQGGLSQLVGAIPALILASLIFGCFHPMTWAYLILTAVLGGYLGALWLVSGNLLGPVVCHALYDFIALLYFLRLRPLPPDPPPRES